VCRRAGGGRLPADGAEGRQLQLGGGGLVVVVAPGDGDAAPLSPRRAALAAAAAAAVHQRAAERPAQAEQQHRRRRRLAEEEHLADQLQYVQRPPGDGGRHVGAHHVADVLRDDAEAVEDGQRHHGAVHPALQTDLLAAGAAAAGAAPDLAHRDQRAADGEERREAEVAAEVPPEAGAVVREAEHVQRVREVGGDADHAALARRRRRAAALALQLADQQLGQRQQQSAGPDDGQLGRGRRPVLHHLVVQPHVGGGAEAVDAQGAEREGRDPQRRHLVGRGGTA